MKIKRKEYEFDVHKPEERKPPSYNIHHHSLHYSKFCASMGIVCAISKLPGQTSIRVQRIHECVFQGPGPETTYSSDVTRVYMPIESNE